MPPPAPLDDATTSVAADLDVDAGPTFGRIFYGWYLVAAVFVVLVVSSGLGFYNASVILAAATVELDASVGAVSGATGLFFAVSGLTGFAFSKRLDSADIRWFYLSGGIIGAVALLGLRLVSSVAALYVFFAVFGVGFALAGLVPSTTLVTRWFDRRRSVALSIASTGLSVGGIVLTPVAAWLIDNTTLSGAAPWMAALWLVGIVPIALLVLRSNPSDRGLRPDGESVPPAVATDPARTVDRAGAADPALTVDRASAIDPALTVDRASAIDPALTVDPAGASGPVGAADAALATDPANVGANADRADAPIPIPGSVHLVGLDFATARRTRFFAALCLAYAVVFFGQVGAIAQLFNMVQERAGVATASTSLSVLALSSVIARLIGGALVTRIPTKPFTAALAAAQAAGLVFLALATSSSALIISAAVFGISIGNLLMLQPLLLAEAFGVVNYGRIYSFNQLVGTIGVAGGPFGLGVLRDTFDYRVAFLVAAAASLIGCLFVFLAGPTDGVRRRWAQPPTANRQPPIATTDK